MVAAGVPILENRPDCIHFGAAGHVLGTAHTLRDEFTAYVPSRPHLEWQIRRTGRRDGHRGHRAPLGRRAAIRRDRQRVTGVRLEPGGPVVDADLVVDAAGRGTRLPVWLDAVGI